MTLTSSSRHKAWRASLFRACSQSFGALFSEPCLQVFIIAVSRHKNTQMGTPSCQMPRRAAETPRRVRGGG